MFECSECVEHVDAGDSDFDLVTLPIVGEYDSIGVYENVGSASVPVWEENPALLTGVAQEQSHHGGVFADLDCDGRPDLVLDAYPTGTRCYRNDGPVTAVEQMSWGMLKALYR